MTATVHRLHADGFVVAGTLTQHGWAYACDGFPVADGCTATLILRDKITEPTTIPTGRGHWLACFGADEYGEENDYIALTYCPPCARVVCEQETQLLHTDESKQQG